MADFYNEEALYYVLFLSTGSQGSLTGYTVTAAG